MGVVVALVGLLRTMVERRVQSKLKVDTRKTRKQNGRKRKQLQNDEEECTVKKYLNKN